MKIIKIIFAVALITALASCSMSKSDSDNSISPNNSRAGSLARFSVVDDYLYTVTTSELNTISLANKEHPIKVTSNPLNFYTETIFPYNDLLLLGTDNGMYVYSIVDKSIPAFKTFFRHIRSCDPVVAQNGYAYLTLNTSNVRCYNGSNLLQIIDISDINNITLKKEFNMDAPNGLDINNDTLYVCDNGIKILDVSDKQNPQIITYINDISAKDIIYNNGILIITGNEGLKQYKYKNGVLELLSSISASR
ncbi:MAG: hypothetical protein ACOXZ9_01150 [Bacteroidales bacterium]|jgi:hypothetical protein